MLVGTYLAFPIAVAPDERANKLFYFLKFFRKFLEKFRPVFLKALPTASSLERITLKFSKTILQRC